MADPVIPRIGEAEAPTERPGTAGDGLAPRRQPPIAGGVSEERQALAARNLVKYQNKRRLINAIEMLDCVEDAGLINAITLAVPKIAWDKPNRSHWRK